MDMYDGVNLSPLEVVFVKVKRSMLQAGWTTPKTSQIYDKWRADEVRDRDCYKIFFALCIHKALKPFVNSNLSPVSRQLHVLPPCLSETANA